MEKEFLYVGHYTDINGNYILKIGTTNDLPRRALEHTRTYRKSKVYRMPQEQTFCYDWHIPLSKYNTIRYEDRNRSRWQETLKGMFIRNDRFCLAEKPDKVEVTIRKTYTIDL